MLPHSPNLPLLSRFPMSELADLHRHISTLPSDVIGTLACFCFNHHSTLAALAALPMTSRAFSTAATISGTPRHILSRWLMRNKSGALIVAHAINDCKYTYQLADSIDELCEPAGESCPSSSPRQDAMPPDPRSSSLISLRVATGWRPSLALLTALCTLPSFNVAKLCEIERARTVVVNTLKRWERYEVPGAVAVACRFGDNIAYDPRQLCLNVISSISDVAVATHYILCLFHSCSADVSPDLRLERDVRKLWEKKKQTLAVALGLFAPTVLAALIPESVRFVCEVSRLRVTKFSALTQLIEDHLTWCAIQESEQTDAFIELQKNMAVEAEQESIKRTYTSALSHSAQVIRCVSCAKPFDPDVTSYTVERAQREHVCATCAPAVRSCVCCKASTRGALCVPGHELAIPLCCDCYRDRQSSSSVYRSPMQWPLPTGLLCSIPCETCREPIRLRADQFCSVTSVLASTSSELHNDVCVETFGHVAHSACLATCETCSAPLDIGRTRIISGMPYCSACWMVCPGCRDPVLCSIACAAPSSRRPPNERCYHRQRDSPDIDDDDEGEYNARSNDDLACPASPDDLHLFA